MGRKLYVGNLSYSVTDSTLRTEFSKWGTVDSVKIITDRDTGRSKGFGFIEMSTDEEAQNAIENMNGSEFDGRKLTINEARPQPAREERSGGFGGGRSGGFGASRGGNRDFRSGGMNKSRW